jgi:hypothetical protein
VIDRRLLIRHRDLVCQMTPDGVIAKGYGRWRFL